MTLIAAFLFSELYKEERIPGVLMEAGLI